ncbi:hypothetical protein Glove_230g198 [Diversispora epigaea]|uniref:Uncharacterized protein n=1 Tax=Diversispora epigaea TaxID=1348612 RepID=A0A397IH56_9GLOM|nr:hypothetical protein Glove_230g198 [Diversispora epigaea]
MLNVPRFIDGCCKDEPKSKKVIEFEKRAPRPRRHFQSSFRLFEKEELRKSCWRNLVKKIYMVLCELVI